MCSASVVTRRQRRRLAALAIAGFFFVAACGDDDTDEAGAPARSEEIGSYCDGLIALATAEPDVPEDASEGELQRTYEEFFADEFLPDARRVRDMAPDDVRNDLAAMVKMFEEQGPDVFEDPQYGRLNAKVQDAAIDDCDVRAEEVVGVDYAYEDAPDRLEAGTVGFRFDNTGEEVHEMIILRRNDDTTESFDELLQLPREEIEEKVEGFGGWLATPGERDARIVDLPAGDYIMICTIPLGTTSDLFQAGQDGDGPPHFTEGMLHEFTVE